MIVKDLGCARNPGQFMVISLYAHGMTVRDIVHHLDQVYGTQLSAETVSRISQSQAAACD